MGVFPLPFISAPAYAIIICILASLSPIHCENSTIRPESRIIHGEETREGEFPHQAFVSVPTATGPNFCGGSILNADYIVTAAHCVDKVDATKIFLAVGKHDIRDFETPSEFHPAAEVIVHPCFDQVVNKELGFGLNDIAIVKLAKPLPLDGRNVKAIQIDEQNLAVDAKVTQAIGWGRTNRTDLKAVSAKLKKANFTVITTECKEKITTISDLKPEGQICVFNKNASTCGGDSGGPLLCDDGTGKSTNVLCGIDSFGHNLDPNNSKACSGPTIFTRVYHYRSWIKAVLAGKKGSVEGCIGEQGTSRGCLSYCPSHFICGMCLILIFLSFYGKKIFETNF